MHAKLGLGIGLVSGLFVAPLFGASLATTYNYGMTAFVEDTASSTIYATIPSLNSIAVINANTLQVTKTIGIGSNPTGLTLSPDGSRLYVATHGSSFVGVIDTTTKTALSPLALSAGDHPVSVQYGMNNRLFVLTDGAIKQIDATTGASAGSNLSTTSGMFPLMIYEGNIRISPDRNSLYYATGGISPSYLYKYDVNTAVTSEVWVTSTGSNGQDVALSHDGSLIVNPQGGNATNDLLRTSDLLSVGSIGPATRAVFSPDDKYIYSGINTYYQTLTVYDLTTYLVAETFQATNQPSELFVDNSGGHLFVNEGSTTEVFNTGHAVPEPTFLSLLAAPLVLLSRRSRR